MIVLQVLCVVTCFCVIVVIGRTLPSRKGITNSGIETKADPDSVIWTKLEAISRKHLKKCHKESVLGAPKIKRRSSSQEMRMPTTQEKRLTFKKKGEEKINFRQLSLKQNFLEDKAEGTTSSGDETTTNLKDKLYQEAESSLFNTKEKIELNDIGMELIREESTKNLNENFNLETDSFRFNTNEKMELKEIGSKLTGDEVTTYLNEEFNPKTDSSPFNTNEERELREIDAKLTGDESTTNVNEEVNAETDSSLFNTNEEMELKKIGTKLTGDESTTHLNEEFNPEAGSSLFNTNEKIELNETDKNSSVKFITEESSLISSTSEKIEFSNQNDEFAIEAEVENVSNDSENETNSELLQPFNSSYFQDSKLDHLNLASELIALEMLAESRNMSNDSENDTNSELSQPFNSSYFQDNKLDHLNLVSELMALEMLAENSNITESVFLNTTGLIEDKEIELFQEVSTAGFEFLIESETTQNFLLTELFSSATFIFSEVGEDSNDSTEDDSFLDSTNFTLLRDSKNEFVLNNFTSDVDVHVMNKEPALNNSKAENATTTVKPEKAENATTTVKPEKKDPECPPPGFCIFWFAAQDTCAKHSHCLGSRICCKSGCSMTCLEVQS